MSVTPSKLYRGVARRLRWLAQESKDALHGSLIRVTNRWPCFEKKYLLVGSESSGTTAVANLLFQGNRSIRFLEEGEHPWVWGAYQSVYQKKRRIEDYPRLQLFTALKVPGFATILAEFLEAFPNTDIIYLVRDPRDVVNSAIKTWKVKSVAELAIIPWVKENWLSIPNEDPVERLAIRWRTYLRSAMRHGSIVFVRYEDFCADKLATIADLASRLQLSPNPERICTLANIQLSHKSVRHYAPEGPGGWRKGLLSREDIKTIETLCWREMCQWSYDLHIISPQVDNARQI